LKSTSNLRLNSRAWTWNRHTRRSVAKTQP
jgi:hypothetical protein